MRRDDGSLALAGARLTAMGWMWGRIGVLALLAPSTAWAQPKAPPEAPSEGSEPAPGPHYYLDEEAPDSEKAPTSKTPAPPPERAAPPSQGAPPPGYGQAAPGYGQAPVYEPPPPGAAGGPVYEPPPPPRPRHRSPRNSFWLGARGGWLEPFGEAWANCVVVDRGQCLEAEGAPISRFASPGPKFELNLGARLSRSNMLFLLWERSSFSQGSADDSDPLYGGPATSKSNFYALGIRFSSDPDDVGLLVEIAIGGRSFSTTWEDGRTLELAVGIFESRLGLGVDIRVTPEFALSPMAHFGGGGFGSETYRTADGTEIDVTPSRTPASHGWFSLDIGAHFDLFGSE